AKALLSVVLLLGLGYMTWNGLRRSAEHRWLERARRTSDLATRHAALEKAFAIEPHNSETSQALGELLRAQSWERGGDYPQLAASAMQWFQRTMTLNPYDGYGYLRYGMCLDLVGRTAEAGPYFDRAVQLDPNGYFTAAWVGWHYFQAEDYSAAQVWFERAKRLEWNVNPIADAYLPMVRQKLLEQASGEDPAAVLLRSLRK